MDGDDFGTTNKLVIFEHIALIFNRAMRAYGTWISRAKSSHGYRHESINSFSSQREAQNKKLSYDYCIGISLERLLEQCVYNRRRQ